MLGLAPTALRLLPYLLAGAALIGGYFYVRHLQNTVVEQRVKIEQNEAEKATLKRVIDDLSQQQAVLDENLRQAEDARSQIRKDLDATLRKLRNQKPPVECKAAIDWSIQNKGDLAW